MKKNLLFAALVLPLLSVSAQWTQTGGTVVVKPNTLHYITGDYTVDDGSSLNEGNVNVRSNFAVEEDAEFRNVWNDAQNYGQLIINQTSMVNGNVHAEFSNTSFEVFTQQPLSLPFDGVTADDIRIQSGITSSEWQSHPGNSILSNSRWRNPVFIWDNANYALDDLMNDDVIAFGSNFGYSPTSYYAINQQVDNLEERLSVYSGKPANMAHVLDLEDFEISAGTESSVNNYSRNIFGEMLGTYLKDPFVEMPDWTGWSTSGRYPKPLDFGENLYYFGNPYTSNINLNEVLPTDGSVIGIQQFNGNEFIPDQGVNHFNPLPTLALWNDGSFVGDELGYIRPFHTFAIKVDANSANRPTTLDLNESVKNFIAPSNAHSIVDRNSVANPIFQLKLELIKDDMLAGRSYIVANTSYEAAGQSGNEAFMDDLPNNVHGIYTMQESADGNLSQDHLHNKLYINGINSDTYVALPVFLVHQVAEAGEFTLNGILSSDLITSENKFYFEDEEENIIYEITPDFEYNFTATETTTERFRIYWNGTPEQLSVEDITLVAKSIVYKDNEQFKVRFAKDWNTADVYVYNMMGQLIHSAKQVDASFDYTLPLRKHSAAYIVKAVDENGNTMTQKIITK